MDLDLVVLGAGPAGLATALGAAERGLRVVLIERADEVGGMARSFRCDGIRVDHGSHRLHPAAPPAVMDRLSLLLGDDLQLRARRGRLRLAERWVDFPLRAGNLLRAMPIGWVGAVGRDVLLSPLRGHDDSSYASMLRASLGPTAYETLYAPYAVKLWGLPGESIDPEQARVRVSADTPGKVASRVLRASAQRWRSGSVSPAHGTAFRYPRRGFGQIVDALEDAARRAGVDIQTGKRVVAVKSLVGEASARTRVRVDTADGSSWQAPCVLSTLPLPVLARLARPTAPGSVLADAAALRFRAMALVYLTHERPLPDERPLADGGPLRWTRYDAHYLPAGPTPVTRISEPANYRQSADDPVDRTVLCAELPCDGGDQVWRAEPDQLASIVHEAIKQAGLPPIIGPRRRPGVHVRRIPTAYPVYDHGFASRLARLERWAETVPGVSTLGRAGLFTHDNTHHALMMAHAAVAALRPGAAQDGGLDFDEHAWQVSREAFREHVVED